MSYKSLCVVITDWGDPRDQIFSRTGFAPSVPGALGRPPHRSAAHQRTFVRDYPVDKARLLMGVKQLVA